MFEQEFSKLARRAVAQYVNEHMEEGVRPPLTEDDVYIVWMVKALQNNKALCSTDLFDGMYYELTYNGDKKQLYLDAYEKRDNVCIEV